MPRKLAAAVSLALVLLSSCGYTHIARIQADPARYRTRIVRVEGQVTKSAGALNFGGYQVDDGTGRIYVLSDRGAPAAGTRVSVSGTVVSAVQIMGHTYGTAIREQSHKVHF